MANIQDIPIKEKLRKSNPKINQNFKNLNDEIAANKTEINNKVESHINSPVAHPAQHIPYKGAVLGASDVKQALDNLKQEITDLVLGSGDSGPEVAAARGGYSTLGDRLDAFDAQLADKASKRWFDVIDYGAKGDGVTDDIRAINAAIAAASAVRGIVFFPSSSGNYMISEPIVITPHIGLEASGSATIEAFGDSTTDGIVFDSGNYTNWIYRLPNVINFVNGAGVRLKGASLVKATIPCIANCRSGLMFETSYGYTGCIDNTIDGISIFGCTNSLGGALHFKCENTNDIMQGNIVRFNFFNTNYNSIFFDKPADTYPDWDDTLIEVEAIDGAGVTGSRGIYAPNGMPPARTTIKARTFFGGFDGNYLIGGGNHNTFELAFVDQPPYSKINFSGVGNRVVAVGGGYSGAIVSAPVMAMTIPNSRDLFNGGIGVYTNKMYVGLPITDMNAGQIMDFYIYSPFTTGYSHMITATPHFTQPILIQCIEDESAKPGIDGHAADNQIHIRIVALASMLASTQTMTVELGL